MRKAWSMFGTFSALFLFALSARALHAAPEYVCLGNPDATPENSFCLGVPSGRVIHWLDESSQDYLGQKCEAALNRWQQSTVRAKADLGVDTVIKNPTYEYDNQFIDSEGRADAICRADFHLDTPGFVFQKKVIEEYYFVCSDDETSPLCAHHNADCVTAFKKAVDAVPHLFTARLAYDASLLQGNICRVEALVIEPAESNANQASSPEIGEKAH